MPRRIKVSEIIKSRYQQQEFPGSAFIRPLSWDERVAGVDIIKTDTGEEIKLDSNGAQATPSPGWVIMLTGGDEQQGFQWTLYGIPKKTDI